MTPIQSPKEIFNQALELKDPEKQAAFLDEACAGDEKLRAEVDALLKWDSEAGSFMDFPDKDPNVTLEASPALDITGTVIGRYKLLEKIGEGGMATVYMAEQKHPIRRRVALKIIKLGMDTKQVIARFEAERQALAMMDHPNIAKVFDAGSTDSGRPYFIMELVKGISITEFCDKNNLNTRERLELFISVCQAVHHAHQKGIIHRDIKPSNIMVTLHDGEPVVKVIDFGISKALNQQLTEKTVFTRYSQMIGTPEYMSPEQAEMSGLDVDTRTDVFSLGVLLYELLTGTTPFDSEYLLSKGYGELQRIIREEEPVRPSTRISTLGESITEIAKHRRTSPDLLCKMIRTDLDWIVMKTLEKNRRRRYESVSEFAADIKRHMNNEPVMAGRPSKLYRVNKFVRRNKALCSSVAAIAIILILSAGISSHQAWTARKARISETTARTLAEQARNNEAEQRQLAQEQAIISQQKAYAAEINVAFQALQDNNLNRARELLNRQRPETGKSDLRGWEWRYLWQCCRTDELASYQDEGKESAAFSRDNRYLATADGGKNIVIRDLISQKATKLSRDAFTVAFSPTDDVMVGADYFPDDSNAVTVWDTKTWRQVRSLPECCAPTVYSPDGKWLVTGAKGGYRIWDTQTWTLQNVCPVEEGKGPLRWWSRNIVAFSPNSNLLLVPFDTGAGICDFHIFELPSLKLLDYFDSSPDYITSAAFLSNGKHLLTSHAGSGNIYVWDIITGKIVETLAAHTAHVAAIVDSPDGQTFFSASTDSSIVIWDAHSRKPLTRLRGHEGEIYALAVSPDSRLLASLSFYRTTKLWDTATRKEALQLHGTWQPIGFAEDSQSLIALGRRGILHWDISTRSTTETPIPWIGQIFEESDIPADTHDGKMCLVGSPQGTVEFWDLLTHECTDTWPAFEKKVTAVGFSGDGRFAAAATRNGAVKIRDIAAKREISEFSVKKCRLDSISFSPDNRYLAVAGRNRCLWLFDVSSNRLMHEFDSVEGGWLCWVTFSPDGQTLAAVCLQDKSVWLWEVSTRKLKSVLRGHQGSLWEVDFMPDGKTLATVGEDNYVKLWNLDTYQEVASLSFDGRFGWMEISPDGKTLAVGHGRFPNELKTTLRQAPSFEEIAEIEAKENTMAQKQ